MSIRKYSLSINGHRTSISLEQPFHEALSNIAREQGCSLAELIARIDEQRRDSGLSSAIRVYVLRHFQVKAQAREEPDEGG